MDHDNATDRFYALIWPLAPKVLRIARYLVRGTAEADDLAQETLIKAFKGIGGFRDGTNVRAWLMTILLNTRTDRARAAASTAGTVSLEHIGVQPMDSALGGASDDHPAWDEPDELLESFSDRHVIRALHELPEEIRWTLLLVEVDGMDHEDAARVLDVPVGTVKSRAFRGRAMLREALLPVAKDLRLVR